MVEIVTMVGLPIDEKLMIKKNRIAPAGADPKGLKRISVVTGIHGDELEGQYVCYELQRRISLEKDKLTGIVDIYPAMNPLGIDSITRGIPAFDLDMNRIFPGNIDGNMTEYIAAGRSVGDKTILDSQKSLIVYTAIPFVIGALLLLTTFWIAGLGIVLCVICCAIGAYVYKFQKKKKKDIVEYRKILNDNLDRISVQKKR